MLSRTGQQLVGLARRWNQCPGASAEPRGQGVQWTGTKGRPEWSVVIVRRQLAERTDRTQRTPASGTHAVSRNAVRERTGIWILSAGCRRGRRLSGRQAGRSLRSICDSPGAAEDTGKRGWQDGGTLPAETLCCLPPATRMPLGAPAARLPRRGHRLLEATASPMSGPQMRTEDVPRMRVRPRRPWTAESGRTASSMD